MSKQGDRWEARVASAITRASSLFSVGASVGLILMTAAMGIEVFSRYVFRNPTIWAFEISHYLLAVVMVWGMAYGLRTGAHIRVEIVRERVTGRRRRWLDGVTSVVTVGIAILLFWMMVLRVLRSMELNQVSPTLLAVPVSWPQAAMAVGFLLFALQAVVECWRTWRSTGVQESEEMVRL